MRAHVLFATAFLFGPLLVLGAAAHAQTRVISAPTTPQPVPPDVARIRCQDVPTAVDNAVKIRQRELGAREGQAGVVPLVRLKGQTGEQIARELTEQFAPAPAAATQVGLLDTDGDARLDGFVDVPAAGIFRLARQRADGTVSLEVFTLPGSAPAYGELARRLDENTARQAGQTLADMLTIRPVGPLRIVAQTGEFGQAYEQLLAGNFADAARIDGAAARSTEFQNLRGESVRVIEIISPVTGGVALRRLVVLARPNDQELWEETTTVMRPVSYWRTDVEVSRNRETRTTTGALVGTRSTSAPVKFSVER